MMNVNRVEHRIINYCALLAWGVILIIIGGCASPAKDIKPPQAPDGMSGVMLEASPGELALGRSDLPAGFQLAAEKSSDSEYVALYLRPSALDPEASGGNALLSVLTSVAVYTTTADAEQVYLKVSDDPAGQQIEGIELVSDAATDLVTQPIDGSVLGADASDAYRVTYQLMGQPIFEYGHRVRLGNVMAYVVVAAIGNPDEPAYLLEDTDKIVQRQLDLIAALAPQSSSE